MRKKEICDCGKRIDAARQALELEHCEQCARKFPGNILNDVRKPLSAEEEIRHIRDESWESLDELTKKEPNPT